MGIRSLVPHLQRVYPQHVDANPEAPLAANLLVVDFMNALYTLAYTQRTTDAGGPLRLTGAEAFERVSRSIVHWLTAGPLPRRAIIITDKPGWVPLAKKREQESRRAAQEKQAAQARASGAYMDFADRDVVFSDAGVACIGCAPVAFDGFSVIHQRKVRDALIDYLREKFARLDLPVGAELVLDMDTRDSREALLVNARPHGAVLDDEPAGYSCTMSPLCIGHAWCCARRGLFRPSVRTGEAEVLAIQYALQHARSSADERDRVYAAAAAANTKAWSPPPPAPLTICLHSADGDTVAVACAAFWDPPAGVRVLWWQRTGITVDLTALYAGWHHWPVGSRRRCTPEHVVLALISMGTDYAEKRDLFNWINEDALWDAICRFPLEILRDDAAGAASPASTSGDCDCECAEDDEDDDDGRASKRARSAHDDEDDDDDAIVFTPAPPAAAAAAAESKQPAAGTKKTEKKTTPLAPMRQMVRNWRHVDRLVMCVYAAVGVTLKGADKLLPWTGSVDDHRNVTPGRIIRLYNELKQKRISPPFAERPREEPEAAAAAAGGKRVNATRALAPYREACVNVATNVAYWLAVPRNEPRIDGVIA